MAFTPYIPPALPQNAPGTPAGFTPYVPPANNTDKFANDPYAHPLRYAANAIGSAAGGAVDQFKEGLAQASKPGDAAGNLPFGALKMAAAPINFLGSIAAPVLKPVGTAITAIGDRIGDVPAVQNFALSKPGEYAAKAAEGIGNAATIAGALAGATSKPAVSAARTGLDTAGTLADKLPPPGGLKSKATLQTEAIANINKGLGNVGKKSATGILTNDTKRLSGLETLYTMTKDQPISRSDGTTFTFNPTKIAEPHDLLSAFVQAKNQIWDKVQAGLERGSSVKPDFTPVISAIEKYTRPGNTAQAAAHAATRLSELEALKNQGVEATQTYLKQLNSRLGATFSGASDAIPNQIDAEIAHGVNNALDKGLSTVKDAAIRPYKDMYASLKALEPDLVRMVQKTVRQTGKGIPQYINDFGNINILEAVFAHNPALYLAKGGAMKVLSKVLGAQRDPLDHLSKAFQAVEGYLGQTKPPTEPPTLALPPGNRAPSQVSSGAPINLPAAGSSNLRTTIGSPKLPTGNK
jgi:hypothetical protein